MTRPPDPEIHDKQSDHNERRRERARSWFDQSKKKDKSVEEKFICLWIAFNAAYGDEGDVNALTETERFTDFLEDIIKIDERKEGKIRDILWKTYSEPKKPIQDLLDNQCVFKQFWQWARGEPEGEGWRARFDRKNDETGDALVAGNVLEVFKEVLKRLYQLRNQVFHGGVTFGKGWGRSQLEDGTRIMAEIVPVVLEIVETEIKRNLDTDIWGKVAYPRVGQGDLYRGNQKE